jgi:hypothetical protein
MSRLFETIRELVSQNQYIIGQHAAERLEERGIMEWQAVAGLEDGELLVERPDARPNPAVEVWSHLRQSGAAKLVTVHFFDE